MKALLALLADRRRSQSGSVLSAVLIITAFLAIIAGALGTEISTNFLLSRALVDRVSTEATVNSAAELAINQLQGTPLNASCPSLTPAQVNLNSQTAVVNYVSCAPVVYWREQQFVPVAASSQFTIDGTLAQLPGLNDYVVADSGGTVFAYRYGSAVPRLSHGLGASVTGPPLVMPDPDNPGQFLDLIPSSGPSCAPSTSCVNVVSDSGSNARTLCPMPTTSAVVSRPAAGSRFPNIAFFGDTSGNIYAFDTSAAADGGCATADTASIANRVVTGPVVFACNGCGTGTDEVFVMTSSGGSSSLVRLTYTSSNGFNRAGTLNFPWANPMGMTFDAASLRLAISYAGGQVALVQLGSGGMNQVASRALPTGISRAPYWCRCPGSGSLIGIGGRNGSLYVLDTNLNIYASYAGGPAIDTTPVADAAGDWYFAANDGRIYEVQKPGGSGAMILAASFGAARAAIGSSPVIASCPAGICIYLGSLDGSAYLVSLDARDAVMTACINSCGGTGPNPRLWTHVQVGASPPFGNLQTVHVQGWSYYSP